MKVVGICKGMNHFIEMFLFQGTEHAAEMKFLKRPISIQNQKTVSKEKPSRSTCTCSSDSSKAKSKDS
jgi:hypothetical protein